MKTCKYIFLTLSLVLLCACGAKKKLASGTVPAPEPEVPAWHTCLIQGTRVTIVYDGERISAPATMQVVRDSLIIVSVSPLMGIEMLRLEATPEEMVAFDKIHGQYMSATYAELNRKLQPQLTWDILQQACSAELPTGSEQARLAHVFDDKQIELIIVYGERKTDVPLRINRLPLSRYTRVDISKWL